MSGRDVTIVEVGPRDGLQNEAVPVTTGDKVAFIDLLSACGFARIEAASFVSPKWVPQMADGGEVMRRISRQPGTVYSVLTPNMKGFEAALAARADEVAIFASASETFSLKNINCTIAQSIERFRPLAAAAEEAGVPLRGYVSCVAGCPYEGPVAASAVASVTERLFRLGCHEVSLGDTIGAGTPETIGAMLDSVLQAAPAGRLAGHYHDTNGRAAESIVVSLEKGLRIFDSAIGGLGGCPYAPGAKGNVDTLKVHALLEGLGYRTGLDTLRLEAAAGFARQMLASG